MKTEQIHRRFEAMGVFPIVVIDDPEKSVPMGQALLDGGLHCIEVTFRTPEAEASIRELARAFPELLLGAGTVLEVDQVKRAVDAGARFMLAPGLDEEVVHYCLSNDIAVFPGVSTPTEMQSALRMGLKILKFFPAEALGGLNYLKAVSAPLSMIRFLPTGGVNLDNLAEYLTAPMVLACAGTWIVKKDRLAENDFETIREEAARAVEVVRRIRGGSPNA